MIDPRVQRLADLLIDHSVALQPGEHILIETFEIPESAVIALVRAAKRAGGHPHVEMRSNRVLRALLRDGHEDLLKTWADSDLYRMQRMQAYLGIRGSDNVSEFADVSPEQAQKNARLYTRPVHFEERVNNTRWCVLRWPTPGMAQLAQTSTEAFEDFYFDVCTLDYERMAAAAETLKSRMAAADQVHISGPGETDLRFSIRGIPVIACCGHHNIPDGECFTAPVRDSVEGVFHANTPTIYNGVTYENVRLVFREGRIVEASAEGDAVALRALLDTDEGARFIGEFAIGFHPLILEPMKDILFDEKIAGSLHFTPGQAYEDADNGNRSEIHWDLVLIQRPEYGGGTIAFDGEVIRRDGLFVPEELTVLNPDRLLA